jgi:ABC-2 type transport system ATP-binding protein
MIEELGVERKQKIKALSKGTKEKLSLILTLSRNAKVYILDEPIAGVDPAAREYILQSILSHKKENATVIISTHLISEIEQYFDYVLFLKQGNVVLHGITDEIRAKENKTIDELFREVFRWM